MIFSRYAHFRHVCYIDSHNNMTLNVLFNRAQRVFNAQCPMNRATTILTSAQRVSDSPCPLVSLVLGIWLLDLVLRVFSETCLRTSFPASSPKPIIHLLGTFQAVDIPNFMCILYF